MKLGFICPNLPGHLNPMTALARHLQDRNHDVVFLYSSSAGGLPCTPGPEKDHFDKARPELSKLQGKEALKFALTRLLAQTETILKSLPMIVHARKLQKAIAEANGLSVAADLVEESLGARRKTRATSGSS
jgi:zeaxanthin glucosyltransferase